MAKLTLANVNKALKAAGFEAELVKGKGYLWFDGDEPSGWYSSVVEVCYPNHIPTVEGWVEKYKTMKADDEHRRAIRCGSSEVKN